MNFYIHYYINTISQQEYFKKETAYFRIETALSSVSEILKIYLHMNIESLKS